MSTFTCLLQKCIACETGSAVPDFIPRSVVSYRLESATVIFYGKRRKAKKEVTWFFFIIIQALASGRPHTLIFQRATLAGRRSFGLTCQWMMRCNDLITNVITYNEWKLHVWHKHILQTTSQTSWSLLRGTRLRQMGFSTPALIPQLLGT